MEMNINIYLIFSVLYRIMLCDADVIQKIWETDDIGLDSVFADGVLFTTDAESTTECILRCQMKNGCNGISFEKSNLRCTAYDVRQLDVFTPKTVALNTVFYIISPASSKQCGEIFPIIAGVKTPQRICSMPGCTLSYTCAEGYTETGEWSITNSFCQENGSYSLPHITCSACVLGSDFVGIPGRYFNPVNAPGAPTFQRSISGNSVTESVCKSFCIGSSTGSYVCKVAYYMKDHTDRGYCLTWPLRVEDNPELYSHYLTYNPTYTEFVRTCNL